MFLGLKTTSYEKDSGRGCEDEEKDFVTDSDAHVLREPTCDCEICKECKGNAGEQMLVVDFDVLHDY